MSDTLETRGAYRVVIHPDTDAEAPDADMQGSVYYFDDRSERFALQHAGKGPDLTEQLIDAWERFGDTDTIGRYLRMFYGAVGFDYFDTRDGKYVSVVTADDLTEWGFSSIEEYRSQTGHADPSHGILTEWRAYADGDVWGYSVEKLTHWTADDGQTRDTWEEVDSCWGFYGREWAEEAAIEALDGYAMDDES